MGVIGERSSVSRDGAELGHVLEAGRAAIAQEFERAQRLGDSARTNVTIAGAWFAAVQTIAGVLLSRRPAPAHAYIWAIIVLAVVAAVTLVAAMLLSREVWKVRDEDEVSPSGLIQMASVARSAGEAELAEKLVQHYVAILASRRKSNQTRADALKSSMPWWIATVVLGLAEVVAALIAVALG